MIIPKDYFEMLVYSRCLTWGGEIFVTPMTECWKWGELPKPAPKQEVDTKGKKR